MDTCKTLFILVLWFHQLSIIPTLHPSGFQIYGFESIAFITEINFRGE